MVKKWNYEWTESHANTKILIAEPNALPMPKQPPQPIIKIESWSILDLTDAVAAHVLDKIVVGHKIADRSTRADITNKGVDAGSKFLAKSPNPTAAQRNAALLAAKAVVDTNVAALGLYAGESESKTNEDAHPAPAAPAAVVPTPAVPAADVPRVDSAIVDDDGGGVMRELFLKKRGKRIQVSPGLQNLDQRRHGPSLNSNCYP